MRKIPVPESGYHELAVERGFRFVGSYTGRTRDNVLWRCPEGHEWSACYVNIKSRGSGCPKCYHESKRHGREQYEELARSRGYRWIGKKAPRRTDQKTSWECSKGHQWQAEYRVLKGCPHCDYEARCGANSPNYNHDITDEERGRNYPAYYAWRSSVFARDGYTCRICNSGGGTLSAHHIYGFLDYPERRHDVDNGITLCEKHHKAFHTAYGRKGFGALDFQDYLSTHKEMI